MSGFMIINQLENLAMVRGRENLLYKKSTKSHRIVFLSLEHFSREGMNPCFVYVIGLFSQVKKQLLSRYEMRAQEHLIGIKKG